MGEEKEWLLQLFEVCVEQRADVLEASTQVFRPEYEVE